MVLTFITVVITKKMHRQDGDKSSFPPLKVAVPQLYTTFAASAICFLNLYRST